MTDGATPIIGLSVGTKLAGVGTWTLRVPNPDDVYETMSGLGFNTVLLPTTNPVPTVDAFKSDFERLPPFPSSQTMYTVIADVDPIVSKWVHSDEDGHGLAPERLMKGLAELSTYLKELTKAGRVVLQFSPEISQNPKNNSCKRPGELLKIRSAACAPPLRASYVMKEASKGACFSKFYAGTAHPPHSGDLVGVNFDESRDVRQLPKHAVERLPSGVGWYLVVWPLPLEGAARRKYPIYENVAELKELLSKAKEYGAAGVVWTFRSRVGPPGHIVPLPRFPIGRKGKLVPQYGFLPECNEIFTG